MSKKRMKMGTWIKEKAKDDTTIYRCSECGMHVMWKMQTKSIYPDDICPNCGADMVSRRTACLD